MSGINPIPSCNIRARVTDFFLGIDLGTSGTRLSVIDACEQEILFSRSPAVAIISIKSGHYEQKPGDWWQSVSSLINNIPAEIKLNIRSICVDGTSGSILLCDDKGQPSSPALMYNDNRATSEAEAIRQLAPLNTGAQGTGSSLAKLFWLLQHGYTGQHALHQADWVCGNLRQHWNYSDSNNGLKLGFDPVDQKWPAWLEQLPGVRSLLPEVFQPGSFLSGIDSAIAYRLGLPPDVSICAGTTDSIAAFIATDASEVGDAVTALGSTLVIKVISNEPVFAPEYGIYSHRLQNQWLVGGASNTGGAVLKQFFTQQEMDKLTSQLNPAKSTDSDFYPLPGIGERFPVNDPEKLSRIRPMQDRLTFFQALLEGIAAVEKLGYEKLAELGCPYPVKIFSTGGGAKNPAWRQIRTRLLQRPVLESAATEAAYGVAKLALRGWHGR